MGPPLTGKSLTLHPPTQGPKAGGPVGSHEGEKEIIGTGFHERAIIDPARFLAGEKTAADDWRRAPPDRGRGNRRVGWIFAIVTWW
jgi:hypothetical protein